MKRTTWAGNITIMRFLFCEKGHKPSVTRLTERNCDMYQYSRCRVPSRGTPTARHTDNEAGRQNDPGPKHGDTPLGCLVQWKAKHHPAGGILLVIEE